MKTAKLGITCYSTFSTRLTRQFENFIMPSSKELKDAGLKTTLPRLRILSVLEEGKGRHYTAEDVYKELLDAGRNCIRDRLSCVDPV